VYGTQPDQAINPDQTVPPTRRVVRLDAAYLGTGAQREPVQDANEPEEEPLIVLPRRSGSWLVRFVRWLFS
jgi:hypothetical protein